MQSESFPSVPTRLSDITYEDLLAAVTRDRDEGEGDLYLDTVVHLISSHKKEKKCDGDKSKKKKKHDDSDSYGLSHVLWRDNHSILVKAATVCPSRVVKALLSCVFKCDRLRARVDVMEALCTQDTLHSTRLLKHVLTMYPTMHQDGSIWNRFLWASIRSRAVNNFRVICAASPSSCSYFTQEHLDLVIKLEYTPILHHAFECKWLDRGACLRRVIAGRHKNMLAWLIQTWPSSYDPISQCLRITQYYEYAYDVYDGYVEMDDEILAMLVDKEGAADLSRAIDRHFKSASKGSANGSSTIDYIVFLRLMWEIVGGNTSNVDILVDLLQKSTLLFRVIVDVGDGECKQELFVEQPNSGCSNHHFSHYFSRRIDHRRRVASETLVTLLFLLAARIGRFKAVELLRSQQYGKERVERLLEWINGVGKLFNVVMPAAGVAMIIFAY